jgi:two-component system OmpR family sensor kinase/two-component system sensor histidine kinase BaeS
MAQNKQSQSGKSSAFWPVPLLGTGLRGQLTRRFLLIILINIGLTALLARGISWPRLHDLALLLGRRQAFQLAPVFAEAYTQSGSWATAPQLVRQVSQPLPPALIDDITFGLPWRINLIRNLNLTPDRVVLADAAGQVLADSQGRLPIGRPLPAEFAPYRVPIKLSQESIGWLVVTSTLVDELTQVLLVTLRQTILGVSCLAGLVALLLSFGLTQRLVNPIRDLSRAAHALAAGDSHQPLPVHRHDELGDLTLAFNQMVDALATQQRLRRQMVADIAHELRTPLSVMRLEVESLSDGLQNPTEAAASLEEEVTHLSRLIEDLRLLSLAEAGGLHFSLQKTDGLAFVQHMLSGWLTKAQARQVHLRADTAAALPPIYADTDRLGQVFHNLLNNALRYTPAGQSITLGARAQHAEVWLWVADTGPGVAPADLPFVFERFYRADSSRSHDTGGSGLGLAIARQWVLLHGGRIWVESDLGQGATFYVALPIYRPSTGV